MPFAVAGVLISCCLYIVVKRVGKRCPSSRSG